MNETEISFIDTVNNIQKYLPNILQAVELFDINVVESLDKLSELDLKEITDDLKKSNYLGNRKIDIDLSLNNQSETELVSYQNAKLTLNDGSVIEMKFETILEGGGTSILELTSHADIKNYIANDTNYKTLVINTELTVEDAIGTSPQLIRFRDADGSASNIDRVELSTYSGDFVKNIPSYVWADTTSALETLSNRVGDVIALGQRIDKIIALADKEDEIQYLYDNRVEIQSIVDALAEILNVETVIPAIQNIPANLSSMDEKIQEITTIRDEIVSINPSIVMLASNEAPRMQHNKTTGEFVMLIPQAPKGERGEAFNIDARGSLANRVNYNTASKDFAYLATDELPNKVYFKNSDASDDWSVGTEFGQGETGISITDISRTAGTGAGGTVDTYSITMSDDTVYTFDVTNGIIPTKTDLNLQNVDNTSDANKPISEAQQIEFNKKADNASLDTLAGVINKNKLSITTSRLIVGDIQLNVNDVEITDAIALYSTFSESNGYQQTQEIFNGTQVAVFNNGLGADGFKYAKKIEGVSGYTRVDNKPSYGMYTKESANDNRDIFDGKDWYTPTGDELVTNGTFETLDSWVIAPGTVPVIENNSLKLTHTTATGYIYNWFPTIPGETYTFSVGKGLGDGTYSAQFKLGISNTEDSYYKNVYGQDISGSYTFVAEQSTVLVKLSIGTSNLSATAYFDDISLFKSEPTIGTKLPPQSYLEDSNGNLAEFEVAGGVVVSIGKWDYVPSIVENKVRAKEVEADEFIGKNACTAWVNFDGTTTPPTIRDSFNVRDVVRLSTGFFDIIPEKNWNAYSYSIHGTSNYNYVVSDEDDRDLDRFKIAVRKGGDGTPTNRNIVNIQVFGGKN